MAKSFEKKRSVWEEAFRETVERIKFLQSSLKQQKESLSLHLAQANKAQKEIETIEAELKKLGVRNINE